MNLSPEDREVGKTNFAAAIGSKPVRREFLLKSVRQGLASRKGLGSYYFGYEKSVKEPVRVGVIGTGDEGGVLIGALNPEFIQVRAIADIRPYNVFRAFHGDCYSESQLKARPGLLGIYKEWTTEEAARNNVKVYAGYEELIGKAREDKLEAVIIALPLHLHAPVAVAAMQAGLHVITEKLMGHTVHECKEMARVAAQTKLYLAVGHQRHYSILYNNAVELIQKGVLGNLHYIRAQWHRGNLPGNDSWQMPLPPGVKNIKEDPAANKLADELKDWQKKRGACQKELDAAKAAAEKDDKHAAAEVKTLGDQIKKLDRLIAQKEAQIDDKHVRAEKFAYEHRQVKDAAGNVVYDRPAIEELIRWRLWDRTGAGLMAELGSHQLDAASIFIAAMHGGKMQHPLSVSAAANRPLFPPDRDIEDHVYCVFEFPAPGYDAKDPQAVNKRIGVQYASINGNGFGGYGETVFGTDGTLILEREQEVLLYKRDVTASKTRVVKSGNKTVLDLSESGDEESAAVGQMAMLEAERGYAEELEHWAWCIRNPAPENQPRCHPKVALKDAVIALTANMAAREGARIDFQEEWFDTDRDETPEKVKPDTSRYKA
ncbi:MAG: Gfo/Idh/MocA family oxidoreductase [Thermoguttaceae bacterium]|jgi:predicted dehydrogenase